MTSFREKRNENYTIFLGKVGKFRGQNYIQWLQTLHGDNNYLKKLAQWTLASAHVQTGSHLNTTDRFKDKDMAGSY